MPLLSVAAGFNYEYKYISYLIYSKIISYVLQHVLIAMLSKYTLFILKKNICQIKFSKKIIHPITPL